MEGRPEVTIGTSKVIITFIKLIKQIYSIWLSLHRSFTAVHYVDDHALTLLEHRFICHASELGPRELGTIEVI